MTAFYRLSTYYNFIQAKECFIDRDEAHISDWINYNWYFMAMNAHDTTIVKKWLALVFSQYHSQSETGLAYWNDIYDYCRSNWELGTSIWEAIQLRIAKDFGKDSDEYVSALFGQANFFTQIDAMQDYKTITHEVECFWGPVQWVVPIPNRNPDSSHYYTKVAKEREIISKYIQTQEAINKAGDDHVVEQMPRFLGCDGIAGPPSKKRTCADQKLMKFMLANIKYPAYARENGIEGTVFTQFSVDKKGCICDLKTIRGLVLDNGTCAAEAIRFLSLMNELPFRWAPWIPKK